MVISKESIGDVATKVNTEALSDDSLTRDNKIDGVGFSHWRMLFKVAILGIDSRCCGASTMVSDAAPDEHWVTNGEHG